MKRPTLIQSETVAFLPKYLGFLFFFLEASILLLFLRSFSENEPGAELVVVLFAIPPVLQLLGLLLLKDVLLKDLYSLLSLLSSGFYFVSLLYYMLETKPSAYSGWLCILASAGLVVLAFWLTSTTFRDSETTVSGSIMSRVAARIGTSPSGEILVFLAFFVSIGYLLGFALAFNDRNLTTQGLLPGLIAESIPGREGGSPLSNRGSDESRILLPDPDKNWQIFFNAGSAKVAFEPRGTGEGQRDRERWEDDLSRRNKQALFEIIDRLLASKGLPVRVTLIAHSDEIPLSHGYQYMSNYELAGARASSVRATILDLLSKRENVISKNIEWLDVPLPEPSSRGGDESSVNQRAVEVLVRVLPQETAVTGNRQIRLLTLLEHVYFSMYTITTTGYGDIKPSTPYAMFVCTIENLYEVFFMVVFFNVLLSPKARGRRRNNEKASPAQKPAAEEGPPRGIADNERSSGPATLTQPASGDSESNRHLDSSSNKDATSNKKRETRKKPRKMRNRRQT
jgi:hypothetical protein